MYGAQGINMWAGKRQLPDLGPQCEVDKKALSCLNNLPICVQRGLVSFLTVPLVPNWQTQKETDRPTDRSNNQTKPNQTKPTKQSQAKANQPNQAKPNQAKPNPNQAKPNQAKPNQAKPNPPKKGKSSPHRRKNEPQPHPPQKTTPPPSSRQGAHISQEQVLWAPPPSPRSPVARAAVARRAACLRRKFRRRWGMLESIGSWDHLAVSRAGSRINSVSGSL